MPNLWHPFLYNGVTGADFRVYSYFRILVTPSDTVPFAQGPGLRCRPVHPLPGWGVGYPSTPLVGRGSDRDWHRVGAQGDPCGLRSATHGVRARKEKYEDSAKLTSNIAMYKPVRDEEYENEEQTQRIPARERHSAHNHPRQ